MITPNTRAVRLAGPDMPSEATVQLPLSKSASARRIIMDAVAGVATPADAVAQCDDTAALLQGVGAVTGTVDIGLAGTAMRFLTAYYAATPGAQVTLTGNERMCHRPIGPLVDALRALGADIEYAGTEGCPPLRIRGVRLKGGRVDIDAGVSSQYLSALMMISPLCAEPVTLALQGQAVSLSYVRMTAAMMAQRGVETTLEPGIVKVHAGRYNAVDVPVEADWSGASYWYAVSALTSWWVNLPGLELPSQQGDSAMAALGQLLGVLTELADEDSDCPGAIQLAPSPEVFARVDADMTDTPDIAQTVAMCAAALGIPFCLTGVSTLRHKETDRIAALIKEALKLGFIFTAEGDNALIWDGARVPIQEAPAIDTYGDHRMAMAFAPLAAYWHGLTINNPQVVSKSYPDFWEHLQEAGYNVELIEDEQA